MPKKKVFGVGDQPTVGNGLPITGKFRHGLVSLVADQAIRALHMVYHERDFRIRVNPACVQFVKRQLAELTGVPISAPGLDCPACRAGYNVMDLQPTDEDHNG